MQATGREKDGQAQTSAHYADYAGSTSPFPAQSVTTPLMRRYTQSYAYDAAGNLTEMAHTWGSNGWTRGYAYAAGNNQLLSTSRPGDTPSNPATHSDPYAYDDRGAMVFLPHLNSGVSANLVRDFRDQIRTADLNQSGDVAWYATDAGGQRVRKVWDKGNVVEERIYVGPYEVWRQRDGSGNLQEKRQTLHVMDDQRRIAMVETLVQTQGAQQTDVARLRFQLDDHLGTATVEVDDDGGLITYEEYHPYGSVAWKAEKASMEVSPRRYRYTGMERDDETGLQVHGVRYYAPWLGRWCSADPIGLGGGANRFEYARSSPTQAIDPGGTDPIEVSHFTSVEATEGILRRGFEPGRSGFVYFTEKPTGADAGRGASRAPVRLQTEINVDPSKVHQISKAQWSQWYNEAKSELYYGDFKGTPGQAHAAADAMRNQKAVEYMTQQGADAYRIKTKNNAFYVLSEKAVASARVLGMEGPGAARVAQGLGIAEAALAGSAEQAAERGVRVGLSEAAAARFGTSAKVIGALGKPLLLVAVAADSYRFFSAENKPREGASIAGGWSGAWIGMRVGARAGAYIGGGVAAVAGQLGPQVAAPEELVTVPVAGAVGGIIGGLGGAVAGYLGGSQAAETVYDWAFTPGVNPNRHATQ